MGLNLSTTKIRQDLLNYLSVHETNNLIQQIEVVLKAKNEIIFKNIAQIRNVNISFYNNIKNQIVAKLILNSTSKADASHEILNKISEMQNQGGIFEANLAVLDMIKKLQNVVDISTINNAMQNLRDQFEITNSFIVVNDQLLPNSYLQDVDLRGTNELYNNQVYDALSEMYNEATQKTKDDDEFHRQQTADNTMALAILGVCAVVGLMVYMKGK